MTGTGRALPHKGLSALQPWRTSKANRSTLSGRKQVLIGFMRDRTMRWTCADGGQLRTFAIVGETSPLHSKPLPDGVNECNRLFTTTIQQIPAQRFILIEAESLR